MKVFITIILLFSVVVFGQQAGTATEAQPAITVQECTASSCTTIPSSVTVDANWRWLHTSSGSNCYTGNSWSASACSDPDTCAQNCVLEGVSSAEYSGTYGIKTSGSEVSLGFVTVGPYSTNVGSRVYLMENTNTYRMFQLLNKEFTVDVDASQLGCGLNGALYFVEMAADGGLSEYSGNKAGAKFGTGYCDAQCPHDVKFINGEANLVDWTPSAVDPNSGKGLYGTCCAEMDIWEANSISTAFTPHPCDVEGQTRCSGNDCGDGSNRYGGVCDKDGCDFNSYRQGNKTFYGPNMMIDSTAKITVVTQFITSDNTDNGDLVEIRRIYKQNNVVIHNSASTFDSLDGASSITDSYCQAQKSLFGDTNAFTSKGGLKQMGESLRRGMVLAMSLWVDYDANCLWLDSNYPVTSDPTTPGVARGSCATSTGVPASVISGTPNVAVKYSNIRWGPIGSTAGTGTPTTTPTTAPTTPPTATPTKKPTVAPTAPPTPAPTKPPTVAPTPTPTVRPTNPPTQAPTRPPTSAPTNAPTSAPTSAPGACADSISFTQTRSGGWTDGTNAYSQWQVTVSNSETIVSLHLSVTPEFNSYWQLNKQSDGTYSLNDWRLSSNQVLPAGSTFDFGYIKVGTEAAEFTVQSATCSATSKRAINNIEEVEEMKFDGSASSLAQISLVLVAGVCVLLL